MSSREAIAAEAIWRRMTVPEKTRRKLLNDYRSAVRAELMSELAEPLETEPGPTTSVGQLDTSGYKPAGIAVPAEYLDGGFPLHAFFHGMGSRTPTILQASLVAACFGEPRRDPWVESVPCPRPDCQAPAGDACRRPYGPGYWLPTGLHHERREVLAERILADALTNIRENTPMPQYVVSTEATRPATPPITMAGLTALYARLNPIYGHGHCLARRSAPTIRYPKETPR